MLQDNLDSQKQREYLDYLSIYCQTDDHFVPPNHTDEVQPVDDGLGRQIKLYIGQEEDAWLEDDANLTKWENNELTASDRRILIAQWYCKAYKRAVESLALRKYFEHTGALLTADGSGDDLIKLEGLPKGQTFSWTDDDLHTLPALPTLAAAPDATEPEPEDCVPEREQAHVTDNIVDDEDEDDEDDAPPAPREAPPGFQLAASPPSAEQLAFSKEASPADALVGRHILFNWPVVGWCVGKLVSRNVDARSFKMVEGERAKVNFLVHYEIDQETVKTVLRLEEYNGHDDMSWVLLDAVGGGGDAGSSGEMA